MGRDSKGTGNGDAFGRDSIEQAMEKRMWETIELLVEEELEAALGAARLARVGGARAGYRHGRRRRALSTSVGPTSFAPPRTRLHDAGGEGREWRSALFERDARRTARVDDGVLGIHLSGTNTRRVRRALAPSLRGTPRGKDAISRLVGRLREDFASSIQRDLATEHIRYRVLDGWHPRMCICKKRVRVPMVVTLGTCADGRHVLLDLPPAGGESTVAWRDVLGARQKRQLGRPVLAVLDGNPGLEAALPATWPQRDVQRCTNHRLWNLLAKASAHLREELAENYCRMTYAATMGEVAKAR